MKSSTGKYMTIQERTTMAITAIFSLYASYFMMIFSKKSSLIPILLKAVSTAGLIALATGLVILLLKKI